MQAQAVHQRVDRSLAGQQAGDHDQHPVFGRNALCQRQTRQAVGRHGLADQAIDHGHHRLRSRKQHQQHEQRQHPGRVLHASRAGVMAQQQPGDQAQTARQQRAQVDGQGQLAAEDGPGPGHAGGQAKRTHQHRAARPCQPMAGHGLADARVGLHQIEQCFSDLPLVAPTAPGQPFDAVQGLVARGAILGLEQGRGQHQLHQGVGAGHDVRPFGRRYRAQRSQRVADAQVVSGLVDALLRLPGRQVRQRVAQPFLVQGVIGGPAHLQALRHLQQESLADTAPLEPGQQLVQCLQAETVEAVAAQIGHFARGLVGRLALGQAAQVLDQHHAQGGRQRPDLAQPELARLLIGEQELDQQLLVEGAVGMGDESPGHAVDARQAGQRRIEQLGQGLEIAARQALVDFLQLRLDHMGVVEQPFGRRADVIALAGLRAQIGTGRAQHLDVVLQARKEAVATRPAPGHAMGLAQALAMLGKALQAEDLGPDGSLNQALSRIEDAAQVSRGIG